MNQKQVGELRLPPAQLSNQTKMKINPSFAPGSLFNRAGKQTWRVTAVTRLSNSLRNSMRGTLFRQLQRPVIVAVSVMRMMQSAINQIIHVIAMRNGSVAAIGTMNVLPVVAFRSERAFIGICGTDGDDVFVHMVTMRMMQMAVVKIIHVPIVHDGDMSAIFAMDMRMVGVSCARM